jgi:predicted permease
MSLTLFDIKYAVRLLVKRPGFTLLSVSMFAGGLGISLYTFAVLNTMLYGELPLPDGGSIVKIGAGNWIDIEPLDAFELVELERDAESFAELGAYRWSRAQVGEPSSSRSLRSAESDPGIFEFTRTQPLLGRGFVSGDSSAGAEPVAVLSFETWQTLFAGNEHAVGALVRIDDRVTRVVGIMPQGYAFPRDAELWLPLGPEDLAPLAYTGRGLETYARLRPGVSVAAVETELTALLQRTRQQRPTPDDQSPDAVAVLPFLHGGIVADVLFGILNLLSISILMLAAVNVGNLLLARTNERIKEVGVRVALGAPRFRLIAQTTLENAILCAIGGVIALYLTARALEATGSFVHAAFDSVPFWWTWSLDRGVVAAAGLFVLVTVLAVSVLPALCVTGVDPNALLRDGTRGGAGRGAGRLSRELVTIQVALISAVMVVGGAAAVVANRAATFDNGMDTNGLLTMDIRLPAERHTTSEQRLALYQRLLAEVRTAPGIDAAAIMQLAGVARFAAEGREYATPDDAPGAWHVVLSDTPAPLGPTLIAGRAFDSRDSATAVKTAIVSASLANANWPGESALDRRIDVRVADGGLEQRTIVGVVDDVNYDPVGTWPFGLSAIYVPAPQFVGASTRIIVRPSVDESRARSAMYEALARVDPALAPDIARYDEAQERITLVARTVTKLFVGCGIFAALLAISGIYGMSSNAVVLRSHEIGLRRALGATGGDIVATFVRQGIRQLARGLGASALLCALVLFAIHRGFAVGAGTLATLGAAVAAVVAACVLLSIYLAVRGVARLEPSATLRSD